MEISVCTVIGGHAGLLLLLFSGAGSSQELSPWLQLLKFICRLVNLEPRGFCNSVFYLWLGFLLTGPYPNVLVHKLAFAKLSGISVNNQALSVSQYFSPPEFIAMYTYESSEQGDLTFQQGDVILVTKKDGDWWTGTVGDKSGVFPSNYVRLKDSEVNPH